MMTRSMRFFKRRPKGEIFIEPSHALGMTKVRFSVVRSIKPPHGKTTTEADTLWTNKGLVGPYFHSGFLCLPEKVREGRVR